MASFSEIPMKRAAVAVASLSTSEGGHSARQLAPCWSCKGPVDECALFCSVCGAVQGPGNKNHFARLGLPIGYDLNPEHLDRQYFGFQRRMHPDRFAAKSPKEKALSQAQATALNDAYETLCDPVKRAVYLLSHMGHDGGLDTPDPALLMEQMELREVLALAETVPDVVHLLKQAEELVAQCRQILAQAFLDQDYAKASHVVVRLKFLSKLVEDAKSRKSRLARVL